MRPKVFIGSATEGIEYARATRGLLNEDADITVWSELESGLSRTIIEHLVELAGSFDFAILILTPDDSIEFRGMAAETPRDNVIFELGLFMGTLGRERTILLAQETDDLKLPSDLEGLIRAKFRAAEDGNHPGVLGAACDRIRDHMAATGLSDRDLARHVGALASRQDIQDAELARQRTEITSLRMALGGMVTQYEFDKLVGLSRDSFPVRYSDDLVAELKHLRAMGLVNNYEGTGLRGLGARYRGRPDHFDLREHFYITDQGHEYLRVRSDLEALVSTPEVAAT
jgi:Predicted nucleotide-binding protein containing TIR-like domain